MRIVNKKQLIEQAAKKVEVCYLSEIRYLERDHLKSGGRGGTEGIFLV